MSDTDRLCASFMRRVVERMGELNVTQSMLARRMRVSYPYISKLFNRSINLSFGTAAKLASALSMDFSPELHPMDTGGRMLHAARSGLD